METEGAAIYGPWGGQHSKKIIYDLLEDEMQMTGMLQEMRKLIDDSFLQSCRRGREAGGGRGCWDEERGVLVYQGGSVSRSCDEGRWQWRPGSSKGRVRGTGVNGDDAELQTKLLTLRLRFSNDIITG